MLERMLAQEVDAFLGRPRYAPGGRATGYRNGHGREREVGIGTWSVPVRSPGSATCQRQRALRLGHPAQAPLPLRRPSACSPGSTSRASRAGLRARLPSSWARGDPVTLDDHPAQGRVAGRVRDLPLAGPSRPLRLHLGGRHLPRCRAGARSTAACSWSSARERTAARSCSPWSSATASHQVLGRRAAGPPGARPRGTPARGGRRGAGFLGPPPGGLPRDRPSEMLEPQGDQRHRPAPQAAPCRGEARLQAVWGAPTRAEAERQRDATVAWFHGRGPGRRRSDAAAGLG